MPAMPSSSPATAAYLRVLLTRAGPLVRDFHRTEAGLRESLRSIRLAALPQLLVRVAGDVGGS